MCPIASVVPVALFLIVSAQVCVAATLRVPANFPTIQAAVDVAVTGDTVLVAPGTYTGLGNKDIEFRSERIVLLSEAGPGETIIDCQGAGRAILIHAGEDSTARVEGFTIRNGGGVAAGGGILVADACPTITDCRLVGNSADNGGGLACYFFAEPRVQRCRVSGNSAQEGGGIFCYFAKPILTTCLVTGNAAVTVGGALSSRSASTPTFRSCTISGNRAATGGGVFSEGDTTRAERTILRGNCATDGREGFLASGSGLTLNCCAVDSSGFTGGGQVSYIGGHVFSDPMLCAPAACPTAPTTEGNYGLRPDSPCLPLFSPCGVLIGALADSCGPTSVTETSVSGDIVSITAHPNPSEESSRILFSLPTAGWVHLAIFDASGRRVVTLLDRPEGAGAHAIPWDGRNAAGQSLPPGVYVGRLLTRAGISTAKIVRID